MKFRKKPVVIEATQWWQNGDHPLDDAVVYEGGNGRIAKEGKVVRYYRNPEVRGESMCISSIPCVFTMHAHGWIDTPEGGHTVCPGDWIITGIEGEFYPCKPNIFDKTYEKVEEPNP